MGQLSLFFSKRGLTGTSKILFSNDLLSLLTRLFKQAFHYLLLI